MLRYRSFVGIVALSYVVAGIHDALALEACATVSNSASAPWTDSALGTFILNQSASGVITGTLTTTGGTANLCPNNGNYNGATHTYTVTGTFLGNGKFSLQAQTPDTQSCSATVSITGALSGLGCQNSTNSWSDSDSYSGNSTWYRICYAPSGETTPAFTSWGGADGTQPTIANFHQNLLPTSYNWGGRFVNETFPQGGVDSCYFQGSSIPEQNTRPGLAVPINSGLGYYDAVGATTNTVNYYRQHGKAPCSFQYQQQMTIDCQPQNYPYIANPLFIGIGLTTVTDSRNDVDMSEKWGAPAPSLILPIIDLLLEKNN
jgi:hypothetical protein